MNIYAKSRIAANTALAQFAPDHGKQAYQVEDRPNIHMGEITVFVIDLCDKCGQECIGANPITFTRPGKFILEILAAHQIPQRQDITEETGCDDDGNCVCPGCHKSPDGSPFTPAPKVEEDYIKVSDDDDGEVRVDNREGGVRTFAYLDRGEKRGARISAEKLATKLAKESNCEWGCNY